MKLGDGGAKVFAGPSGDSSEDKAVERGRMHNSVKDSKGFFLRFVWMVAQNLDKRLEMLISKRGDAGRRGRQGSRSKKVEIMKGPANALKNVGRDALEEVVCEAIVSAEKASGDGLTIPARVRHVFREVAFQRQARKRRDKDAPSVSPS